MAFDTYPSPATAVSFADSEYQILQMLKNIGTVKRSGGGTIGCFCDSANPLEYAMVRTGGTSGNLDAGASSQTFTGNGYVETTMDANTGNVRAIGLSTVDTNQADTTIGWALYFNNLGNVLVYELGVLKGTVTTYAIGDVFRVNRTSTTITYLKNGVVVYTSLTTTSAALLIDTCIQSTECGLSRIKLVLAGVQTAITWTNAVSVTTYNNGDIIRATTMTGTNSAWYVIELPHGVQLCVQGVTATSSARIKISKSAGFTGGSPTCQKVPSATDELLVRGTGTDASPTGAQVISSNALPTLQFAADSLTGAFYLVGWQLTGTSLGLPTMCWFFDPLMPGSYPTSDPAPFVCNFIGSTADAWTTTFLSANSSSAPQARAPDGTVQAFWGLRYASNAGIIAPGSAMISPLDGRDIAWPFIYSRDVTTVASPGYKGRSSFIRWLGRKGLFGDRATINSEHFLHIGNVLVPWMDGTSVPSGALSEVNPASLNLCDYIRGYACVQATGSAQPAIASAPYGTGIKARDFDAGDSLLGPTASTLDLTVAQGQWTVEAIIRPDAIGGTMAIIALAGVAATESLATNFQLAFRVTAAGKLEAFWEYTSGGTNSSQVSTGTTLVAGTSYRVAIVKNATHVRFFVNGTFEDQVAWSNAPDGGTTAQWCLGVGGSGGTDLFNGVIGDVQVSAIARADVDVGTREDVAFATGKWPIDINSFVGWRMGTSELLDVMAYPEPHVNVGGSYTVAGTWTRYSGDGSGIPVAIFDAVEHRLIATAVTTAGGAYTATVPSNVRKHYAVATQDTSHRGRSDDAYPS